MDHESRSKRAKEALLLLAAVSLGLALAWIDARPHWDDTGVLVGLMLLTSGALGMLQPRHAWLSALAIGLWIPLHLVLKSPTAANAAGALFILAIPMAGAYAGAGLRRLLAAA